MTFNRKLTPMVVTVLGLAVYYLPDIFSRYIQEHGWLMFLSQTSITILGVPAIYLSQQPAFLVRRWASVCGLVGQPAWYILTYMTSAWGVLLMSLFYTHAWYTGFKYHWLTTEKLIEDEWRRCILWFSELPPARRTAMAKEQLRHLSETQLEELMDGIKGEIDRRYNNPRCMDTNSTNNGPLIRIV